MHKTNLFCLSSSHFYWRLFLESSHRPANTLSAAPPGMRFSHVPPLFYLLCFLFLTMLICLLWNWRSFSLSAFVIYPFHSCCPSYDVSPSESCYQPLFYLQTPSFSIPPAPISLYPSHAFLIWPACSPGSALKKQRKSKNKLVIAVAVDKTPADLEHSLFFLFHFFPLSTSPSLFLSLCRLFFSSQYSFFFQFTISCSVNFPIPCHLFKGRNSHPARSSVPARTGCWDGELEKVARVARGIETCAAKVPVFRQTSVADSDWPTPLGLYVGQG